MYSLPQELEVWYIIPAIRKELARVLVREHRISYEKAGALLGISKSAVCQYISNKRANKLKLPDNVRVKIAKAAERIIKRPKIAIIEIEKILGFIRQKKCCCELCKRYNPEILNFCKNKPVC